MIPERLKKLVILLTDKTISKKAIWNKGSGNEQFKLSINDGSALFIDRWVENYGNHETYEIVIFNSNGDAIERYNTYENSATADEISTLQKLHKAANDSYYRVEETMEALFEQISKEDIVGQKDEVKSTLPEEDDNLPF